MNHAERIAKTERSPIGHLTLPWLRYGCAVLLLIIAVDAFAREKSDVIRLENGDHLTGEIVELANGKLRVKTDAMGTVSIEWLEVASIESEFPFAFELGDGRRYYGTPELGDLPKTMIVLEESTRVQVQHIRLVRMHAFEKDFLSRLSGSLSFGLNATSASNATQLSFAADTKYQARDSEITLNANAISSRSGEDQAIWRVDTSLQRLLYRGNRWFDVNLFSLERNDEFDLDSRINVGIGRGRYLVQTVDSEWALIGGIQGNIEVLGSDTDNQRNAEGVIATSYKRYIFDDPKLDLTISLRAYPSLSEIGRLRADLDARMRYELVNDLFFDIRVFESYDSDPPAGDGAANDYGVVTSVGWSY